MQTLHALATAIAIAIAMAIAAAIATAIATAIAILALAPANSTISNGAQAPRCYMNQY